MKNQAKINTLNNQIVLVCGGAGFIGSNFIRRLLSRYSKVKIINFDKLTYSGNLGNLKEISKDPRYFFMKGDIADQKALETVFKKYKPNYIINFAAESHVDKSIHGNLSDFINTNIYGVFNLLELLKKYKGIKKFVQISTDEVYGSLSLDSGDIFTEDHPVRPNSPYAATKASGDLLCRSYFTTWDLPIVVTHSSNNYGPYQYPEKLIPFFISRMLEGKKLPIYGDGKNVRDWIYVEDNCVALEACLLRGRVGEIYNIGGDNLKNNLEIARMILKYFGKGESFIEFVQDRPGHDKKYAVSSKKIKKELGWKAKYEFEKSFIKTIIWYIGNKSWVDKLKGKINSFNPHILK